MSKITLTDESSTPTTPSAGTTVVYTQAGVLQVLNSGGTPVSPLTSTVFTAAGQLLYGSGVGTAAALNVGSTGQFLTVTGGLPAWATLFTTSNPANLAASADPGVSTNAARLDHVHPFPTATNVGAVALSTFTTAGDLVYRDAAGSVARLGIGTPRQFLIATTVGSDTLPVWTSAGATGLGVWLADTKMSARDNISLSSFLTSLMSAQSGVGNSATPATGVVHIDNGAGPFNTGATTPYLYLNPPAINPDPYNFDCWVGVTALSGFTSNEKIVLAACWNPTAGGALALSAGDVAMATFAIGGDMSFDMWSYGGNSVLTGAPGALAPVLGGGPPFWIRMAVQRGVASFYVQSGASPSSQNWVLMAVAPIVVPALPAYIDGSVQTRLVVGVEAAGAAAGDVDATFSTPSWRELL